MLLNFTSSAKQLEIEIRFEKTRWMGCGNNRGFYFSVWKEEVGRTVRNFIQNKQRLEQESNTGPLKQDG
jgi:hypothetical protein